MTARMKPARMEKMCFMALSFLFHTVKQIPTASARYQGGSTKRANFSIYPKLDTRTDLVVCAAKPHTPLKSESLEFSEFLELIQSGELAGGVTQVG